MSYKKNTQLKTGVQKQPPPPPSPRPIYAAYDTKGKADDDSDDVQANEQTLNIHQALPPMKNPNFPVFS